MRLIDADAFEASLLAGRPYSGTKLKAYARGTKTVLAAIDAAPTIDPESLRPTAHWITRKYHPKFKCSRCARSHFAPRKFCPECGARMIYKMTFEEKRPSCAVTRKRCTVTNTKTK